VSLLNWLRTSCRAYAVEPVAVFRKRGPNAHWPATVTSEEHLFDTLTSGGYLLPLPKEPAALANVIEVSLVDYLIRCLEKTPDAQMRRGTERGYPDIEISGAAFGGGFHAVDVKVARRAKNPKRTQSAITLYTGNTYFRWPDLDWAGTFRPFSEYKGHLDILAIYTLNEKTDARIEDFEIIVQEPWRIASTKRSSTTREYIGAVTSLEQLRNGQGEFSSPDEFYKYWRKFPFKIGPSIEKQLQRAIAKQRKQVAKA
jgi:hypothetical protein